MIVSVVKRHGSITQKLTHGFIQHNIVVLRLCVNDIDGVVDVDSYLETVVCEDAILFVFPVAGSISELTGKKESEEEIRATRDSQKRKESPLFVEDEQDKVGQHREAEPVEESGELSRAEVGQQVVVRERADFGVDVEDVEDVSEEVVSVQEGFGERQRRAEKSGQQRVLSKQQTHL
ncbi:hypothetical protein HK096_007691 [Nowakowskiella sp. JEL0078]|nr:hypothetical protein HK096_007691 [Nowakowskiella sp. JEL0078]